ASVTYLNGHAIESVGVQDRALHYGDGFFTTLLVVDEWALNWAAHWRRLKKSTLRLRFNTLDESQLLQQIAQAVTQFNLQNGDESPATRVVKVRVSRGISGRGYAIPEFFEPVILIQVSTAPLKVAVTPKINFPPPMPQHIECCQTHASIQMQLAGVKHLNRLDSVLARTEVEGKGHQEGIMLNALAQVVSGTQSNVFMLKGSALITPALDLSGVEGTTRYQLSQHIHELGLSWQSRPVTLKELHQADELFLSNAIRGIMPVKQFEQTEYPSTLTLNIHQWWNEKQAQFAVLLPSIKSQKKS
ncbi:MAG: aminodeoxychorismate lyase, partial [Thiomicrorhabdus sp.]|nr:aminodeoxychorismate lyase [Thiomicrorhabdus sp.]